MIYIVHLVLLKRFERLRGSSTKITHKEVHCNIGVPRNFFRGGGGFNKFG